MSLFFVFYINDLANATNLAESWLFADDTSMNYSNSHPGRVISVMNNELTNQTNVSLWMKSNKLSVNIKKTNYVIFKPKQKVIHMSSSVLFDNVPLKQLTEVKFLGVYLDEALTWKSRIGAYIYKKKKC